MFRLRPSRAWLSAHEQRLVYALIAITLVVVVAASAASGIFLHNAVGIERQTLRTQGLADTAFELQDVVFRAQSSREVSPALSSQYRQRLAAVRAAFQLVRRHDEAESDRLETGLAAYLAASTSDFDIAAAGNGTVPRAQERLAERRLTMLESTLDAEINRLHRDTQVTNPRARVALISAVVAAAVLIALLFWQYVAQRKAGRIDRDIAKRSEELVRLRDEFVASVSHELRTPLTSILGYLELVTENESGSLGPSDAAFLEVVERNAERLLRLVSDLLLVAEADGGMLNLSLHDVDLETLAGTSVEAAKPAADTKGVELTLSDGVPVHITGDGLRLGQMMDNLISNAIKFTPEGGTVTVSTGSVDDKATFEVTDTGTGISTADQRQIFDRFFRSHLAHAQTIPGTGLGLTITKAIVEAHHGTIDMKSTLGRGTTIKVTLPRR